MWGVVKFATERRRWWFCGVRSPLAVGSRRLSSHIPRSTYACAVLTSIGCIVDSIHDDSTVPWRICLQACETRSARSRGTPFRGDHYFVSLFTASYSTVQYSTLLCSFDFDFDIASHLFLSAPHFFLMLRLCSCTAHFLHCPPGSPTKDDASKVVQNRATPVSRFL